MMQYQALLGKIIQYGVEKTDRTGTGTRSIFGHQMRFDLTKSFPLVTTKKLHLRSIIHELLWFISGSTNNRDLQRNGVTIWDEWAAPDGSLGPIYGRQWRSWPTFKRYQENGAFYRDSIDQLKVVLEQLRKTPDSRRLIVSSWNVAELNEMALAPCHCLFQFNTRPLTLSQRLDILASRVEHYELDGLVPDLQSLSTEEGTARLHEALTRDGIPAYFLDLQLYQRSVDTFLGLPFNIASYALFTHMVAQDVNMVAGDFVWTGGDVHLYNNHIEQAKLQLSREIWGPPQLKLNPAVKSLFDFRFEDVEIVGYRSHDAIAAPIAV